MAWLKSFPQELLFNIYTIDYDTHKILRYLSYEIVVVIHFLFKKKTENLRLRYWFKLVDVTIKIFFKKRYDD